MGMYTKPILDLIASRPGVRTVEIADEVGCDEDMVQTFIQSDIDSGEIVVQSVFAVGGKPTNSYYPAAGISALELKPNTTLLFEGASLPDLPAFLDKTEKTRTQAGINCIVANGGRASNIQVKEAMGLKRGQSPTSFLMNPLKNRLLDRDGDDWILGQNHPDRAPIHFSCAMRPNGRFTMARDGKTIADLSADETSVVRQFMKSLHDEVPT